VDLIIRKANIGDYDKINKLYWQSDCFHYNNEPYIYEKTNEGCRAKEYIESLLNEEKNILIALETENEMIGFLYAYEETKGHLPFHKKRKYIVIDNIVIDENYRNNGYGEKLLDYIIEYAKNGKYNDILLNVYRFNENAIKLYEKKGFKIITQDMILKL
jgi:diamine N-acetyltransferase